MHGPSHTRGPLYAYLLKVSPTASVRESHKWTEPTDGPIIVVPPDCISESMSQPSPPEPLFCALCAAPCLEPRINTPPPTVETSLSTDTTDSHPLHSDWLRSWHLLQVSSGLVNPVTPSSTFHSSGDASGTALNVKRTIPIHAFCLQCVMRTVRRTMYGGFSHEERMMLGWSLPKWTGHGPWVGEMRGDAVLRGERGLGAGYWGGTPVQRERWRASGGAAGGHLVLTDRHSPLDLGAPVPLAIGNGPRPQQASALALLPQFIQLEIIAQILPQPRVASGSPTGSDSKSSLAKLLPEDDVSSFIALTQTCAAFRHLDVPSSTWETLILDNVRRWTLSLLNRWRANPSGVGSASQLWIALDEDFEEPVKVALASARERRMNGQAGEGEEGQEGDQEPGYRVRDVWTWWAYNDAWRSRRRVWYCVVHGCATARDADWW